MAVRSLYGLLTSQPLSTPSFMPFFLLSPYSSTKRSANDCLQKATVLRGGEAGGELYNVTFQASSTHSMADKWQESKYLKASRKFRSVRCHCRCRALKSLERQMIRRKYLISIFLLVGLPSCLVVFGGRERLSIATQSAR